MITVESLTRRYAGFTAVDNVSFTALPGRVTGFLGPNGAGKSTTMRVMVGLTVPTSGTATINGERFADLPNPGLEVGVLLDASAQHAGRTGREILTIAADTMGLPRTRVDEMLELVEPDPHRGQAPGAQLLPRHASTPRHRHRTPRRPPGADPRRTGQRARPCRDPVDARPADGLRQPGRHRPVVLAPAARDRGHRRRPGRDRQRQDRRVRHQGRAARRSGDARPVDVTARPRARPRAGRDPQHARQATARSAPTPTPLGSGPWP